MNKERIDRLFEILNLGNVDEDNMIQESKNFFSMEEFYNEEELEEKGVDCSAGFSTLSTQLSTYMWKEKADTICS